jgi:hypothetical protein
MGHELPPGSLVGAAGVPSITDSVVTGQARRSGPPDQFEGPLMIDNPFWEICERVAEVQALLDDHITGGKHSAAVVVAKAQAVLSKPERLRAMFDVDTSRRIRRQNKSSDGWSLPGPRNNSVDLIVCYVPVGSLRGLIELTVNKGHFRPRARQAQKRFSVLLDACFVRPSRARVGKLPVLVHLTHRQTLFATRRASAAGPRRWKREPAGRPLTRGVLYGDRVADYCSLSKPIHVG